MSVLHNVFGLRLSGTIFYAVFLVVVIGIFPQLASASSFAPGILQHQKCGGFSVDIYSNGTGMMFSATPLETRNIQLSYVDPDAGCAVAQWQSSAPAATQIIFSELTNEPISISLSEENFGYTFATPQNNAGRADHTAILENLEPGKVYSYRIVTRPHPTALPIIGEPRVLIAGTDANTVVVNTPLTPPSTPTPSQIATPSAVQTPLFDAEKFPVVPSSTLDAVSEKPEGASEDSVLETPSVPSALTAVESALGSSSKESSLLKRFVSFAKRLLPAFDFKESNSRFSLNSSIGLFECDAYIVPTLLFLGLLLLLQQLILPALKIDLKNPILYWVVGSMVLTGVSAVFMFYYVSIIGIALFLALLAWYLIQNTPEEGAGGGQMKLLNEKSTATEKTTKNTKERD